MRSDIRSWDKYQDRREDIIRTLRNYRALERDYQAKRELYDQLYPNGVQQMTDMPRGGSQDCELERIVDHRISLRKTMDRNLAQMRDTIEHIVGMVEALPPNERTVIYRRYLLGESFMQVAEVMSYSERTVKRMCGRGLDRIAKAEPKIVTP